MNRQIIENYKQDAGLLLNSIQGLNQHQLNARPVADTWSIQEIVVHMMDSEMIAVHRMRRLIAEKNPLLIGYDESAFARSLFYEKTDTTLAATLVKQMRDLMASTLEALPDSVFLNTGIHSETGTIELGNYLKKNVEHLRHHMTFLNNKKTMVQGS